MTYYDLSVFECPMEEVFDSDTFDASEETVIEYTHRWFTRYSRVVREKATGHHWMASWNEGNTEYQECEPDLTLFKVVPYEVAATVYRIAKE